MFKSILSRFASKTSSAHANEVQPGFVASDDGIAFPLHTEADLFTMTGLARSQTAYLLQLVEEGYLRPGHSEMLLPWEQFFALVQDSEHMPSLPLLGFPEEIFLRPLLSSEGSLADPAFRVIVRGWKLSDGRIISGALKRRGAFFDLDGIWYRLPASAWRVLSEVNALGNRQILQPGEHTNQLGWASVHKEAKDAGAIFDGFLAKTVVLRPESLRLKPKKSQHKGVHVVEVIPDFDGAPANWIGAFDGLNTVPDHYAVASEDGGITHILLSPEVRSVLQKVRALPGRRVAGDNALQLLRNPYAFLGDDANKILDPNLFERDREDAGCAFLRFSLHPEVDSNRQIVMVTLRLDSVTSADVDTVSIVFSQPEDLAPFVQELELKIAAGLPCGFWNGYELELSDFDNVQLEGVKLLLSRWQKQAGQRFFDEIFDIEQYGNRVVGIGVAQKVNSPYLVRQSGQEWLPAELLDAMGLDGSLLAKWDTDDAELLEEFNAAITDARSENWDSVVVPGLGVTLPLKTAEAVAAVWAEKLKAPKDAVPLAKRMERSILQIDDNIEELRYVQSRADALYLAGTAEPILPLALLVDVNLRDHQKRGIAWLQHLFNSSPHHASGCMLADDMGLGKTLQLLTFIATYLESDESGDPVLVVAPVSLLDNWENELKRFFAPGFASVLKLYGTELSSQKFKKDQLPPEVTARGIYNLLRPNWRQGRRIVLTTYETLRDQEFSLARQHWAIIVCDEAQKIKNPASLVSQAARALPARFKIACTGTPVENSLTDLWCLFEFIQPGLLGTLNEFGRKYRLSGEAESRDDYAVLDELRALVEPQILRRLKTDVAKDLPAKIESLDCMALPMSVVQLRLYKSEVTRFHSMQEASLALPSSKQNAKILGLLHTMKMICAHPHSVYPEGALLDVSPKMRWVIAQLRTIQTKAEKVIIFSELRDIQRALKLEILDTFGMTVTVINGDTNASSERGPSRQNLIDEFQKNPGFGIIILSTTAVGFGVNVQAANHVIHFTRCWNPAKEDQATDRAYRIGQTKNVYVYYPTIAGDGFESFEQKLDNLLGKKRALAQDMLHGAGDIDVMELVQD